MSTTSTPTILFSDDDAALGQLDRVFFIVWKVRTLAPTVDKMRETVQRRLRSIHGPVAYLTVIAPDAPMPDAAAREGIARLFSETADRVLASGLAYEGEGFRAAAVRGVVTGIALLVRRPFPHRIFESARAAAAFLTAELAKSGLAVDADHLVACVEQVRKAGPVPFL